MKRSDVMLVNFPCFAFYNEYCLTKKNIATSWEEIHNGSPVIVLKKKS